MAYTVKQVSKLSGVSVRTLHFYDEIGLLKPAYVQDNGYRYYEEAELLRLQQILFFRELGLQLAAIQRVMESDDFAQLDALRAHRELLHERVSRMTTLMATVDKTIAHLEGRSPMAKEELFEGFDWAQQEQYEEEVRERWGSAALEESKRRTSRFTPEDWKAVQDRSIAVNERWKDAVERDLPPDHPDAQAAARLHFEWVGQFYTPTAEVFAGLGELYRDDPRFRATYDKVDTRLADYMHLAMRVFAERELS